jgi:hypothetical protein
MKIFQEPENFYEVLIPLFYFFKLFGLAPITFAEKDKKKLDIVTTFGDEIYSVLLIIGHALATYGLIVLIDIYKFPSDNYFIRISWIFIFHYVIFTKFVSVSYFFMKRRCLIDFLKTVNEFDEKVLNQSIYYC